MGGHDGAAVRHVVVVALRVLPLTKGLVNLLDPIFLEILLVRLPIKNSEVSSEKSAQKSAVSSQ